jgi:ribonuclease Z
MILAAFIGVFAFINADKLIDRFIEGQSEGSQQRLDLLEAPGMSLITVGTAAPLPGDRSQSCNAIFVNGQFLVFDLGRGAAGAIEKLRLPQQSVSAVFISHWHSDHYLDLPHFVNRSWMLGRKSPLNIYGPNPIDSILGGMQAFLYQDQTFREEHHGKSILDRSAAPVIPNLINLQGTEEQEVYNNNGVKVFAFQVNHDPIDHSLGFRIEYGGRNIVLSGDTKKSDQLIRYAKGADILVHEAMQKDFISRASALQEKQGNVRNATILKDIVDYHSSPEDAAAVAAAAGAKKLILSHLAPTPENPISRRFYTRGLEDIYDGPILLAEDGDLYTIE